MVDDVVSMLNVSTATAYRIIHNLNEELKQQGYITIAGRVPTKFFDQRFYSESQEANGRIPV